MMSNSWNVQNFNSGNQGGDRCGYIIDVSSVSGPVDMNTSTVEFVLYFSLPC